MISPYVEKARVLRSQFRPDGRPVYNCAQAVVCAFVDEINLSDETLRAMSAYFGGGLRMASVCGAITGGLMALGLMGVEDQEALQFYYSSIRNHHDNLMDCRDLLRVNAERGGEKMPHCNAMIFECIGFVEEILRARGIIE